MRALNEFKLVKNSLILEVIYSMSYFDVIDKDVICEFI